LRIELLLALGHEQNQRTFDEHLDDITFEQVLSMWRADCDAHGVTLPDSADPLVDPTFVAGRILEAVDHDRREIFVPRWYRPFSWIQALFPGGVARLRALSRR